MVHIEKIFLVIGRLVKLQNKLYVLKYNIGGTYWIDIFIPLGRDWREKVSGSK